MTEPAGCSVCGAERPEPAIRADDPYCSTACCRLDNGLDPDNAAPGDETEPE